MVEVTAIIILLIYSKYKNYDGILVHVIASDSHSNIWRTWHHRKADPFREQAFSRMLQIKGRYLTLSTTASDSYPHCNHFHYTQQPCFCLILLFEYAFSPSSAETFLMYF